MIRKNILCKHKLPVYISIIMHNIIILYLIYYNNIYIYNTHSRRVSRYSRYYVTHLYICMTWWLRSGANLSVDLTFIRHVTFLFYCYEPFRIVLIECVCPVSAAYNSPCTAVCVSVYTILVSATHLAYIYTHHRNDGNANGFG